MNFKERLKQLMKERNMSFIDLHKRIHVKQNICSNYTSPTALAKYANNQSPTIRINKAIAETLGVDPSYLAYGGGIYKKKLDEIAQFISNAEQAKMDYVNVIKTIIERVE